MILPDISKLGQPAKTFGRLIILAILIAIFYFFTNQFNLYFGSDNNEIISNSSNQDFLINLTFDYKITKVVDGDTIDIERVDGGKVLDEKEVMKVRLLGINSPETVDPRRPVECYGKEASGYLKSIADGKLAAIELDNTQTVHDKYGRILAYVYIKRAGIKDQNIFMLNSDMIKNGYAYEYTYDLPYKYQDEFKSLELIAKNNYTGLWGLNTCNGLKTPVAPPVDTRDGNVSYYNNTNS
jgi:micrococcal nuclease